MEKKDIDLIEDRLAHLFEEVILDTAGRIKEGNKDINNRVNRLDDKFDKLSKSIDGLENYVKDLVEVLKKVVE